MVWTGARLLLECMSLIACIVAHQCSHVLRYVVVCVVCVCVCCVVLFFFQAEDGIRDLVRSRGLGDVYKRQVSVPPLLQ